MITSIYATEPHHLIIFIDIIKLRKINYCYCQITIINAYS